MPMMNGLDDPCFETDDAGSASYHVQCVQSSGTEKEARTARAFAPVSMFEHISVLLGKARNALEPRQLRDLRPLSARSSR
jgi:hypothetical protein